MADMDSGWELAYRKKHASDRQIPHEDVESIHKVFREYQVKKILDLGCGNGRHLIYFGKRGYEMYGLDYAPTALRLAKHWLAEEGVSAEFVCTDMTKMPWADQFFDAVICFQTINHNIIEGIRKTVREIYRVLKQSGWLFVTIGTYIPSEPFLFYSGIEVEPNTIILTEGKEKGVPHHFFTKEELITEFSLFSVVDMHQDSNERVCMLARKTE